MVKNGDRNIHLCGENKRFALAQANVCFLPMFLFHVGTLAVFSGHRWLRFAINATQGT